MALLASASLAVSASHHHPAGGLKVQIVNGSGVPELAQQVTRRLREQGIDVVSVANADAQNYRETLVLLRRGDPQVARQVRAALGKGELLEQRDPTLLVDVSVILGRDYAPAAN